MEQGIQALQEQLSHPSETDQGSEQLLVEKHNELFQLNNELSQWKEDKEYNEEYLKRNLQKAKRLIQIRQEFDELIGGEAPSHRELPESLPNAAEESSSHHAAQETRSFDERYHHWLTHASHDAHNLDKAQKLYQEYHELQRHFEEDLGPLLADFWSQLPDHSAQQHHNIIDGSIERSFSE